MRAGQKLKHARRPIPRQRDIPFIIAVEREQVARAVEREIVGVPKAVSEHLAAAADVRLHAIQHAGRGLLDGRCRQGDVLGIQSGVVAGNQVPPAVGPSLN